MICAPVSYTVLVGYTPDKIRYWKIFNYRLKELTDNVDTKNANGMGAMRAMLILTPLLFITAFFEYLWVKIFGGNIDKYT